MKPVAITGPVSLCGTVAVSGAKNAALKQLAAALLTEDMVELRRFPTELVDAREQARFMRECGVELALDSARDCAAIHARQYDAGSVARFDHAFRITYLMVAGQILRHGRARIPYPGGCKLGDRKHDLHLQVWERLGATVTEHEEYIEVVCPRFTGAEIDFPITTVGGTENALLCGAIARGETLVHNAYITPEVRDLIGFLRAMGADIEVHGRSSLHIRGRDRLGGVGYDIMPDRIEALTWIIAAAVTGGRMTIEPVPFDDLEIPLIHLREAGVGVERQGDRAVVTPEGMDREGIQPFDLACGAHPGIHSDMQPFFVLLALCAQGNSLIVDYRYPDRIAFMPELARMAVEPDRLQWERGRIRVRGPVALHGAEVTCPELRGGMALMLAACRAQGVSHLNGIGQPLRGYDRLFNKLERLGSHINTGQPQMPHEAAL
jgi:UDP-N-acetylglucosamine 1-carboxyvinyltransferase